MNHLTHIDCFLIGFASGGVILLAAVALFAAAVFPDMAVRVRRRHRSGQ